MKPKLVLPKKGSLDKLEPEIECPDNVVIIGANGSGKSKMGAWIELHPPGVTIVHRISAQKALMMPLSAPMKNLEESERE